MIENLTFDGVIDLSVPADRTRLRELLVPHPELAALFEEFIGDFLALFPAPKNHKVYSSGMMGFSSASSKESIGSDLLRALQLTRTVKNLQVCKGWRKLISGFRSQFASTAFEVQVAGWCFDRKISRSIEFSPAVLVNGRTKYPEFVWKTQLGELFCECKRLNINNNKINRLTSTLLRKLETEYQKSTSWHPELRLDVVFEGGTTNSIEANFGAVVREASAAIKDGRYEGRTFRSGPVSATLSNRTEPSVMKPETVRVGIATVGPVAVRLVDAVHLSLSMSIAAYSRKALLRLLKEARTQLPPDKKGAVFIESMGQATPQAALREILCHPTYQSTPWVSLWSFDEISSAVWQEGQPFDGRLLE